MLICGSTADTLSSVPAHPKRVRAKGGAANRAEGVADRPAAVCRLGEILGLSGELEGRSGTATAVMCPVNRPAWDRRTICPKVHGKQKVLCYEMLMKAQIYQGDSLERQDQCSTCPMLPSEASCSNRTAC